MLMLTIHSTAEGARSPDAPVCRMRCGGTLCA